jgi:hypothetical protein
MLEMLLVGTIVVVATLYSTWALLPAPARQRVAGRLLPFAAAAWCPDWLRRRIQSAAARSGPSGSHCDGCSTPPSRDEARR